MILWHYCKEKEFKKILKSRTLLLGDVKCCGDPQELNYAVQRFTSFIDYDICALRKIGDEESRKFEELFSSKQTISKLNSRKLCWVSCFSACDTIEDHWNAQCDKSKGLSIGFNEKALINNKSKMPLVLRKVIYGTEIEQKDFKDRVKIANITMEKAFDAYEDIILTTPRKELASRLKHLSSVYYTDIIELLIDFFASFKEPSFKWEQEYRLILSGSRLRQYISNNGISLPNLRYVRKRWPCEFDLLDAVKAITIGNLSNLTEKDVKLFLSQKCNLSYNQIAQINIRKIKY